VRYARSSLWLFSVSMCALLYTSTGYAEPPEENHLIITTLSTAPDRVSGGDVLVRVDVPANARLSDVTVALNGMDVTGVFLPDGTNHALVGFVAGLRDGDNVLTAATRRTKPSRHARLEVRNFPIYGPIFAGPHQTPWICETVASGLGPSLDEHCTVPTRYDWFYRSTAGTFKPLPNLTPPFPTDLAQTTTIDGHVVDYIVRVESGTIDQSIYRIAIIDDPTNPIAHPWSAGGKKPGAGWNHKLFYPFGGGCGPAFRSGRNLVTDALTVADSSAPAPTDAPLSLGYAVAFGTRNTLGTGCDDVISAETVMMIKEHFIEQYGLPTYTVGWGSSGGSMQQHLIGNDYPGLLDALIPVRSFADTVTIVADVLDCGLLNNYFDNIANPAEWPGTRRSKVDGFAVDVVGNTTCRSWNGFATSWQNPTAGFDPVVPLADRYDPLTNPTGARGDYWDGLVNVYGTDPRTGFARSAYDNVGWQYGLVALNHGDITKQEFLDLNQKIGGLDIDGHIIPTRSQGNLQAIAIAYRTGRVNSGENLTLPMIDYRNYVDPFPPGNIHSRERTFAMIERLKKMNGTAANQVTWTKPDGSTVPFIRLALLGHNEWLGSLAADTSDDPYPLKVIRNKPASLKDACWDAAGVKHEEPATLDSGAFCNRLFPVHGNVRIAAGGPLAGDILKCRPKAIDFNDYAVTFTQEEKAQLKAIFPHGVCDFSRPGVGQHPLEGTWLSFGSGKQEHP